MKFFRQNKKIEDVNLDLKSLSTHASSLIQGSSGDVIEFWGGKNFEQPE